DGRVHVHLAVTLAGYHFGRSARPLADLGMVERGGDMLAVKIARLLHRQFPQLQAAIHAGRASARRKEDPAREFSVAFSLYPGTGGVLGRHRAEIMEAAGHSFDLLRLIDVERGLIVIGAGEAAATPAEAGLVQLLEERPRARRNDGVEHHLDVVRHDPTDGGAVFYLAHRIVFFQDDLATIVLDELACVFIDRTRKYVIRGRERKASAAVLDQPGDEPIALLRQGRPGAKEVGRAFLALVLLGIDVERLPTGNDDVLDGVPHRTGDAAQHEVNLVALNEPPDIRNSD